MWAALVFIVYWAGVCVVRDGGHVGACHGLVHEVRAGLHAGGHHG